MINSKTHCQAKRDSGKPNHASTSPPFSGSGGNAQLQRFTSSSKLASKLAPKLQGTMS